MITRLFLTVEARLPGFIAGAIAGFLAGCAYAGVAIGFGLIRP